MFNICKSCYSLGLLNHSKNSKNYYKDHKNIKNLIFLVCKIKNAYIHLPSKQYVVGSNPTRAAIFSFLRKKVVRVSCLSLFYIYRSKSFHV